MREWTQFVFFVRNVFGPGVSVPLTASDGRGEFVLVHRWNSTESNIRRPIQREKMDGERLIIRPITHLVHTGNSALSDTASVALTLEKHLGCETVPKQRVIS